MYSMKAVTFGCLFSSSKHQVWWKGYYTDLFVSCFPDVSFPSRMSGCTGSLHDWNSLVKRLVLGPILAAGFGCVCDGLSRNASITLHIGLNNSSLPPVFLISATATMAVLLSALGVLLCSLASSSDVLLQPEFNLQMVRQKTMRS